MHFGFEVAEQSLLPLSQDSPNREPGVRTVSPSPLAYIPDPHTGLWLRDWLPQEQVPKYDWNLKRHNQRPGGLIPLILLHFS